MCEPVNERIANVMINRFTSLLETEKDEENIKAFEHAKKDIEAYKMSQSRISPITGELMTVEEALLEINISGLTSKLQELDYERKQTKRALEQAREDLEVYKAFKYKALLEEKGWEVRGLNIHTITFSNDGDDSRLYEDEYIFIVCDKNLPNVVCMYSQYSPPQVKVQLEGNIIKPFEPDHGFYGNGITKEVAIIKALEGC